MARSGCRPAVCGGPSGREDSFGRRRRAADTGKTSLAPGESESKVEIREMFRVYESRENIPSQESGLVTATQVEAVVCLSARSHQALVGGPNPSCCPICNKLCMSGEMLMEHMKFVHKDPNASGVPGRYFSATQLRDGNI